MSDSVRKFSDGSVRLTGVTDLTDPSAPAAISSATVTGRLYDGVRRALITEDLAATGTTLKLSDVSHFEVGDAVQVRLDDTLTLHDTTISAKDASASTVTLAAAIPASRTAKKGAWLQKPIGSSFAMTVYGTPAPDDQTWGFIGFYDDDIDLFDVAYVRSEVDFDGGAGLRLFKAMTVPVIEES